MANVNCPVPTRTAMFDGSGDSTGPNLVTSLGNLTRPWIEYLKYLDSEGTQTGTQADRLKMNPESVPEGALFVESDTNSIYQSRVVSGARVWVLTVAQGGGDNGITRGGIPIAGLSETTAEFKGNRLDIRMSGAKVDGVTDDTAAINRGLLAIASVGGGTLFFPAGTTIIAPTSVAGGILQIPNNTHIAGDGMGISIVKIKAASGSYDAIFAPVGVGPYGVYNNIHFSDITFDQNSQNNYPASGADILAHPRMLIAASGASTNLTVERVQVDNLKSINTIYTTAPMTIVRGCRFTKIGGGTAFHDHSTLYMACEGAVVAGNSFAGRGFSAAGATTAIETHGGGHTIVGNVIDTMMSGMNITGITAAGDSVGIVIAGNTIKNVYYGIQIWSRTFGVHTTGYGLRDVIASTNSIRIAQNSWTVSAGDGTPMLGNPLGVFLDLTSTLPYKGIAIQGNDIEFDLSSYLVTFNGGAVTASIAGAGNVITIAGYAVSAADLYKTLWITGGAGFIQNQYAITAINTGANTWTLSANVSAGAASGLTGFGADRFNNSGGGITYWDANNTALNMFEDLTISGNKIINCPNTAIRISAQGLNLSIDSNKIVNPGSSTNRVQGPAPAFYSGVFVATFVAADIAPARILRNEITDNLAVTRMEAGISMAINSAPASILCEGNMVCVTGDAVALAASHVIGNNTQLPTIRDYVNVPNATSINQVLTAAKVAQSSQIVDIASGRTYATTSIGTSWRAISTGTAAPTTGTWPIGSICWNDLPLGFNPVVAWVCSAPGTPGTWTPLTAIDLAHDITTLGSLTLGGTLVFPNSKAIWWANAAGILKQCIGVFGANQLNIYNPGFEINFVKTDGVTSIAFMNDTGVNLSLQAPSRPLTTDAARYISTASNPTAGKIQKWTGSVFADAVLADFPTSTGGPPTGAAGGDLSGTYPNPAVATVGGLPVPTVVSSLYQTGRTTALAATNLQRSGVVLVAGMYSVKIYLSCSPTGTATVTAGLTWTDERGLHVTGIGAVFSGSTAGMAFDVVTLRTDGVTNLTVATAVSGTVTYDVSVAVERLF